MCPVNRRRDFSEAADNRKRKAAIGSAVEALRQVPDAPQHRRQISFELDVQLALSSTACRIPVLPFDLLVKAG